MKRIHSIALVLCLAACASAQADDDDSYALRQAIGRSDSAIQSELLKAAAANKAVQEGIAAFRAQATLQSQAEQIQQDMKQPDLLCQEMGTEDALASGASLARVGAFSSQRQVMSKLSSNANTLAYIEATHKRSNEKFCSEEEAAAGICKLAADASYANLAGADQNALFLFQSRTGGDTYEGARNGPQAEAVDSYIARVVGGAVPPVQLPVRGKVAYQRNPHARAYVETLRRYNAFLSMAAYSLNRIKESRQPAAK